MSFLQQNLSLNEKEKENNEDNEYIINKIDNKENPLIITRQLYPKLIDDYFNGENRKTVDKSILIFKFLQRTIFY